MKNPLPISKVFLSENILFYISLKTIIQMSIYLLDHLCRPYSSDCSVLWLFLFELERSVRRFSTNSEYLRRGGV